MKIDAPSQILNVTNTTSQCKKHQLRQPICQVRPTETKYAKKNAKQKPSLPAFPFFSWSCWCIPKYWFMLFCCEAIFVANLRTFRCTVCSPKTYGTKNDNSEVCSPPRSFFHQRILSTFRVPRSCRAKTPAEIAAVYGESGDHDHWCWWDCDFRIPVLVMQIAQTSNLLEELCHILCYPKVLPAASAHSNAPHGTFR